MTGDYEYNPDLARNTGMEYPNLRRVEWRVTKPVASQVKFARQTISRLKQADFDKICVAYMTAYPNDNELSQAIASLQPHAVLLHGPEPNLPLSRFNLARGLNWILCGPPGTGKTWSALHELRQLLLANNVGVTEATRYAIALQQNDQPEIKRLAALVEATHDGNRPGYL